MIDEYGRSLINKQCKCPKNSLPNNFLLAIENASSLLCSQCLHVLYVIVNAIVSLL